jgi:hypothetical protein
VTPTRTFRLRRSLLSKAIAVWFVVLIVLPFTAPFRVWENGAPVSKAQGDDLKPSEKLAKDAAVTLFTPSALPSIASAALHGHTHNGRSAPPHTLPTVLRL